MKRKLIALTIAGALALGTGAALQAHPEGDGKGHRMHKMKMMHGGFALKHITKELDLTPQQEAQVKPVIDAAKPQLRAIHEEAMQKSRAIVESSIAQIRPVLTPEQQQKLDKLLAAHEKMREAMREMHEAKAD
jgi:Spy/CpxP family protein refolding chaperone